MYTREEVLAMPAGRELDGLVDQHIFENVWSYDCPTYSTDIAAAWEVIDHLNQTSHRAFVIETGGHDNPVVRWRCTIKDGCTVETPSAPLSISKCALLSLLKED